MKENHQRLTTLTPAYIVNSLIAIGIMLGFKYVITPTEPLTPLGVEILGIFLGVVYGWLVVGDIFWPSLFGLVFMGLTDWSTVAGVFKTGFGHNNVMLMLFFFLFTNIINAAGITEYIARWITSRKFAEGKPYAIAIMIWVATIVLYFMVTATAAMLIMIPLVIEISKVYDLKPGNMWTCMVLFGTFTIGGTSYILLPYKSLPLVVFSSYEALGGASVNYGAYMLIVTLTTLVFAVLFFLTMKYIIKPDVSAIESQKRDLHELPKLTAYQKAVLIYFCLVIGIVMIPNFIPATVPISGFLKGIGTPGIMAMAVLGWYALRFKEGKDMMQLFSHGISWGVIFILACAMTVAAAVSDEATGIQAWLGVVIQPLVEGKSPFVLTFILCAFALFLTNVGNNQSVAAIITPILLSIGMASGANVPVLLTCLLLCCNAGFCTPPASATASLIFALTDWIPGKKPYILGFLFSIYTLILCFVFMYPLGNLLL